MSTHCVMLTIPLSDDEFGTDEETDALHALGDELEAAIEEAGLGEYDGNEIGGGEYIHFIYGDNADDMLACIKPIIEQSDYAGQVKVTLRYGDEDDAREVELTL